MTEDAELQKCRSLLLNRLADAAESATPEVKPGIQAAIARLEDSNAPKPTYTPEQEAAVHAAVIKAKMDEFFA